MGPVFAAALAVGSALEGAQIGDAGAMSSSGRAQYPSVIVLGYPAMDSMPRPNQPRARRMSAKYPARSLRACSGRT